MSPVLLMDAETGGGGGYRNETYYDDVTSRRVLVLERKEAGDTASISSGSRHPGDDRKREKQVDHYGNPIWRQHSKHVPPHGHQIFAK